MIGGPGDRFKEAGVLPPDIVVRRDPDGTIRAHSPHPLGPYPERLTEKLDLWAAIAPERHFRAERDADGAWKYLTYGEARTRVRRIAQAFLRRGLSADRTLLILSGNSIEHALLALAAMYAGVPYAPAAPAYSLMVTDHSTLGQLVEAMRPGLIFAEDGVAFEAALRDVTGESIEVVTSTPPQSLRATPAAELETIEATGAVDDAHARVTAATVAKVLFTSGSTGRPKAVINTQRMLCANQEQLCTVLAFLRDGPPTLCDWLPWNHTFGGNHDARVRQAFAERLARYNTAYPGSSTSICRALILDSPPSLEAMEITDKGSINQRAVLARRQAEVERLWDSTIDDVLL